MKIKKLRRRTATRIATRRTGAFNTTTYCANVARRREFATELGFWGGLAVTVFTGGAALPLTAIFMSGKVIDLATKTR